MIANSKRIAVIIMVLALIAMSFAGCDNDTAENNKTASTVDWEYVSPEDMTDNEAYESDESDQNKSDGQPPSGNAPSGEPPEKPDGGSNSMPQGGQPPSGGMPGGGPDTATYDYKGDMSGVLSASGKTKSSDGEKIDATEKDQNAILAENGATVTVTGATITKTGSDEDGDNCNFYGLNSSVLAVGKDSVINISDSTINSNSAGSNGIFATDNATVNAKGVTIKTTEGGNSRGLDATYGGTIYANDMDISTEKDHCAALATDRGGGYISVTNSKLATEGSGSPLIYSTGDIEVDNVTGTSSGSQIAGIEGKNRIVVNNSTLESTNDDISGSDPIKNGVILYQSTSGDADTASTDSSEFEAVDSTLKTNISNGAMFYVTNTTSKIVLQNTELDFDSDNVQLINASGNDSNNWGESGNNGGNVTLSGIDQSLEGQIYADKISSADVYLTQKTEWLGATAGKGNVAVSIDSSSKWIVSDDCEVSDLIVEDGGQIIDTDGKTVTIKDGDKVIVKGDSDITVTVNGDYGTEFELPEAAQLNAKVLARDDFDKQYDSSTQFGTNATE